MSLEPDPQGLRALDYGGVLVRPAPNIHLVVVVWWGATAGLGFHILSVSWPQRSKRPHRTEQVWPPVNAARVRRPFSFSRSFNQVLINPVSPRTGGLILEGSEKGPTQNPPSFPLAKTVHISLCATKGTSLNFRRPEKRQYGRSSITILDNRCTRNLSCVTWRPGGSLQTLGS